ncbi:MAG: class I SAM-dependent methyltransferase [Alphaproteobacteria bacterium]|nr:class I SAM-dependent methyltransferase [Alphaproteobacteria bacterium]
MPDDEAALGPHANVPGNVYDKYNTKNPVARWMVRGFIDDFLELAALTGASDAFEIGCGEGELSLRLMRRGWNVRGVDLDGGIVRIANDASLAEGFGEPFSVENLYDLTRDRRASLVVCCEVLEHLPEPERALHVLAVLTRPWLLLSVPREPLWRILNMVRGKYVSRCGNTPGHIQHWNRVEFLELVSRHFEIVQTRHPFPWTMVLCRLKQTEPASAH